MSLALDPRLGAVDETAGFAWVDARALAAFAEVCASAQTLLRERPGALTGAKSYLNGVLTRGDFETRSEFVRLALDEAVLDMAQAYLGEPPMLRSVQVYYTGANDTLSGSQKAHFDHVGQRQLKLFIYLIDIAPNDGPLCFITADASAPFKTGMAKGARFDDAALLDVPAAKHLSLLGPAGSAAFVDTTRCLHYGGRARAGSRLMFVAQYVRASEHFEADGVMKPSAPPGLDLSPAQRAALR